MVRFGSVQFLHKTESNQKIRFLEVRNCLVRFFSFLIKVRFGPAFDQFFLDKVNSTR